MFSLSHVDISNDLDGPVTRFSRSRHFEVEYLKYRAFHGQSFYRALTAWYHFHRSWVTPDRNFKITPFLKSNIGKRCVLKKKLLLHKMKNT